MSAAQRFSGNKESHQSGDEPIMTVVHSLITADGDLPCRDERPPTIECDGVDVRAQSRHLATVLTISGDVDASNSARVSACATALVPVGNALLVDLSGVAFFAAQSLSMLIAVYDACHSAELPWAVVTSHAVDRVLRISQDDDIFPMASSVPDAMQYFVYVARVRRQVPLPATRPRARRVVAVSQPFASPAFRSDTTYSSK
jgi:anti-anti-sigma factor